MESDGGSKQSEPCRVRYIVASIRSQRTASSFSCKTNAVFDSTFVKNHPRNMQSLDERGFGVELLFFSFSFLPHAHCCCHPLLMLRCSNCYQHESQTFGPFFSRGEELLLASFTSINTCLFYFNASRCRVCVGVCEVGTATKHVIPVKLGWQELSLNCSQGWGLCSKTNFNQLRT